MLYSNDNDYKRCIKIIEEEFSKKSINVNKNVLDKVTKDVMKISYAKGGDYSYDTIQRFANTYIRSELFKKFLD